MRTTLDIDDNVLAAVKEIAAATRSTAGAVLSQLALKGLASPSTGDKASTINGFPVFDIPAEASPVTPGLVKALLTDEGLR